jgi:hypothetical protein
MTCELHVGSRNCTLTARYSAFAINEGRYDVGIERDIWGG